MTRIPPTVLALLSLPAISGATTYQVGPSRTYHQLSDVANLLGPGDRVEVDGDNTYDSVVFEQAGTAGAPITVVGIPVNGNRPILEGGNNTVEFRSPPPYTSGADHYVLEGFEITGGTSRCVYHSADDLTLRNLVVHGCPQQGILGGDYGSGSLLLEYSEIYDCGSGTFSHQIYMSSDEDARPGSVFRMQFNYVHDGNGGNNVKSRAERNEIYYNWIEGAMNHELELIGCDADADCQEGDAREDADVVGNVLWKRSNGYVVRVGGDKDTGQAWGRYRFVNNTFVTSGSAALRLFLGIESVEAHNNVFYQQSGAPSIAPLVDADWLTGSAILVGSNNWIKTGATNVPAGFTGTVTGADPSFTNLAANDLGPLLGSPLIDAGAASTTSPSGHAIPNPLPSPLFYPPVNAPMTPGAATARPSDGSPDIGAFELGGVATCSDGDGDGFGSPASGVCPHLQLDCDDDDIDVHPDATETCNSIDDNCDGGVDESCPCTSPVAEVCDDGLDNDCDTLSDDADVADCPSSNPNSSDTDTDTDTDTDETPTDSSSDDPAPEVVGRCAAAPVDLAVLLLLGVVARRRGNPRGGEHNE